MEKLIELETNPNIKISSKVISVKKPDFIYIPILPNSEILVSKKTKVKIGTPIIKNKNNIYFSSISGEVNDIKKVTTINGLIDAIEIKNDFEEKSLKDTKVRMTFTNLNKEYLDKILNFCNIDLKNTKNLILNCIDDEPYVLTENFYLFLNLLDYLEVLDKLSKVYNLNISIAIKSTSSHSISELNDHLGMYPNIKLEILPNLYLLGESHFLLKYLNLNNEDTEVIKASTFYHISNYLKKNRLKTDELITISGDNIKDPCIIKAKIGSKAKEVLKGFKIISKKTNCIVNGGMRGKEVNLADFIITEDVKSILIMKDKGLKKESKCLNCGACIDICPLGLNPLLLNNPRYVSGKEKCIECGLCSYICPANINFNDRKR